MDECENCGKRLTADELLDTEIEWTVICRGEEYDTLESVPAGRRDECITSKLEKNLYECERCGLEQTKEK
ncbi:hypothetical protein ACXWTF_12755 [Thiomicrolovo sp. ZZH C-3]